MNIALRTCMITLGVLTSATAGIPASVAERNWTSSPTPAAIRTGLEAVDLMDGDIILRRTSGLRGRIARTSDLSGTYSHAGLVSLLGGKRTVVHADPESKNDKHGSVIRTSLDDFADNSFVERVAVYRLRSRDSTQINRAMRWVAVHAVRGTPFDSQFDASDSTAMYCTELIWRAYRVAGIDIVAPAKRGVGSLFSIDSLILLSGIEKSLLLRRVHASPNPEISPI